jgi:hypothetical protein
VQVVSKASERPPLDTTVKAMLIVWCSLLPLWAIVASISGMAFDGGPTVSAYIVFYWFVFAYPTLLVIAFFCRRKSPLLVWLPLLAFLIPFADVFVEELALPLLR